MSKTLKNIKIPYATEGVIRSAQLSDTIAPENSAQLAVNLNFDRVGSMQTRLGVTQYLATLVGGAIKSFGTLNIQGGAKYLFAQVGAVVSASSGGAWSTVRTASVTTTARFSQWLNRLYMVNGTDALQCSSGGAFSAEAGYVPATTMPVGHYISVGFDGRIWIANKTDDALYYSDIVQFNAGTKAYTLTYTATNFISNLSPQDGQSITGLFRVPRALLVFKQNSIIRVYSASNVDPFPAYNVGTFSQESIVQAKDGLYFHHSSGFYKFAYDGQPIEISRRVIDFVKGITRANYDNVRGIWDGYDAIEWHVGSVTVEGATYANCVMRYSISTQVWTIYDYGSNEISAITRYDNGTTIYNLIGTTGGKVGQLDTGTTDFGNPITFEFIDRWRSFTEMYSKAKNISGIMVAAQNAGGTILQYQSQKSTDNAWEYIDTLDSEYDSLFPNASTEDFSIVRLRLTGNSIGTPMVFNGVELLSIQDKGFEEN